MSTAPLTRQGLRGTPFAKMTGSGNDFVFFDGRVVDGSTLKSPDVIKAICNRHNGIGADGIVILEPMESTASGTRGAPGSARILYFNSDGTPADLCGNATLCSTIMSVELGLTSPEGMDLETPAGRIRCRVVDGVPEIQLQAVKQIQPRIDITLEPGERAVGFAIAGIPHVVLLCDDAESIAVSTRGPFLRRHAATGAAGANVNWVSPLGPGLWRYRTFERGVEGETLACGTGAVATAVLLTAWGLAESPIRIRTSSGRDLSVALAQTGDSWTPTLRGEGRVVFRGHIGEVT